MIIKEVEKYQMEREKRGERSREREGGVREREMRRV